MAAATIDRRSAPRRIVSLRPPSSRLHYCDGHGITPIQLTSVQRPPSVLPSPTLQSPLTQTTVNAHFYCGRLKMEIAFDLTPVFPTEIVRLDGAALRRLNPRRVWAVQKLIDQIGKLSTEAQGLRRVLTTYDKVAESEDQQAIYLLWQKSDRRENMSNIIGMLKVGQKKLYLFDKKMRSYQVAPTCILDFYVHDSLQRQGYGHRIYNFMLETEGIRPDQVAIDKPSESLIQFMKKHYGLEDPIWQNTNYVVYPGFFEQLDTANGGGAHPNPDRPGAVY
uniref:Alpha-tubulin N-acetyltransferase n=1 Tax=Plectus sambesii TaxID=2011161 RepID=A0A914USG5_9BILA